MKSSVESLNGRGEHRVLKVDGKRLCDEESFHDTFSATLGFPNFYGRNMDAWIDCMSSIDDPDDAMTKVHVEKGGTLSIHIENYEYFKKTAPRTWLDLIECSAFVNFKRVERSGTPLIALSFND